MGRDDRGVVEVQVVLVAAAGLIAGIIGNIGGFILAAEGSDVAPYITGAGTAVPIGALVWVVKKFDSGDWLSVKTAEVQAELAKVQSTLQELVVDSNRREDKLHEALRESSAELRGFRRRKASS